MPQIRTISLPLGFSNCSRRRIVSGAFTALTAALGCGSDGIGSSYATDSALVVDPAEFDLECGADTDAGPGMRSYVATLVRLGSKVGTPVTSSPPTPCNHPVRFIYVEVVDKDGDDSIDDELVTTPQFGADYVVDLFGYEQTGLVATTEGGPTVELDGEVVAPTWTGSCGRGPAAPAGSDSANDYYGPRRLVEGSAVVFRGCTLQPGSTE